MFSISVSFEISPSYIWKYLKRNYTLHCDLHKNDNVLEGIIASLVIYTLYNTLD